MKMMHDKKGNKKGWILIVEVVIAVLILFGFVFVTMNKQAQEMKALREREEPLSLYDAARLLVTKVQENGTLRNYVIDGLASNINDSLKDEMNRLKIKANVDVKILSGLGSVCSLNLGEEEVYVADALISTGSIKYEPKKICVFVWQK